MSSSVRLHASTWNDVAAAAAEEMLRTRGMSQEEFDDVMHGQRRWAEEQEADSRRQPVARCVPDALGSPSDTELARTTRGRAGEKQGWLFKRGRQGWRSWSARYFVCESSRLVYFLNAQHCDEWRARGGSGDGSRGSFPLRAGCACGPIVGKGGSRPFFSFKLVAPGGGHAMLLASHSEADAQAWRALLAEEIAASAEVMVAPGASQPSPDAEGARGGAGRGGARGGDVSRRAARGVEEREERRVGSITSAAELQWRVSHVQNGIPVMVEQHGKDGGTGARRWLRWANCAVAMCGAVAVRGWLPLAGRTGSSGGSFGCVLQTAVAIILGGVLFCVLSACTRPAPRMVKMEMVTAASAETVFSILHDVSKYTSWHPSMRTAQVASSVASSAHCNGSDNTDEITLSFFGWWNFFVREARISRFWRGRRGGAWSMYIEIKDVVRGGFVVVPLVHDAKSSKMPPQSLLTHSLQLAPSGIAHLIGMNQLLATQQMMQIMLAVRDEIEQGRPLKK